MFLSTVHKSSSGFNIPDFQLNILAKFPIIYTRYFESIVLSLVVVPININSNSTTDLIDIK